ncbi:hypothetical protein [Chryseobacterium koreense]|uniref:hypothetical protein n=1 Tax=Chryseobacterium koreense TaxID=232216 RepID=UPI0026F36F34|nr:hypothetical protein [Chryseobacterium koreense]
MEIHAVFLRSLKSQYTNHKRSSAVPNEKANRIITSYFVNLSTFPVPVKKYRTKKRHQQNHKKAEKFPRNAIRTFYDFHGAKDNEREEED